MAAQVRSLPRFAAGLVALVVLQAGCTPKITAPPEPPYSVRRGDEAFRYQDYKGAITSYRGYLNESQKDAYTARVFYKTALAEYRLGQYQDTLETLDQLQQRYPGGQWVQVDALRGDAERELDRPMVALSAWDQAWDVANDNDKRKLRQRIVSLARGFDESQLVQAHRVVENAEVRALLEQQILARQPPTIDESMPDGAEGVADDETLAASGKSTESRAVSGKTLQAEPTPDPRRVAAAAGTAPAPDEVEEPMDEAPAGALPPEPPAPSRYGGQQRGEPSTPVRAVLAPPMAEGAPAAAGRRAPRQPAPAEYAEPELEPAGAPVVACLLPLSGAAAESGAQALRGLQLLFGQDSERLIVMDTESDATTALRLFNQLRRNPDVVAVIGPLRSEDADAVAPVARAAQLPLFLLSERDGLAGGSVLQVGATRSRRVAAVVNYAMERVNMRRFGVLYPYDDPGQQYMATFRTQAERRGGTIVGADAYSPHTLVLPAVTLKRWRTKDDLQAIFLPDDASAAERVAHFLQRDMPDITLLGVSGWESLAGKDDGAVSGILFAEAFFSGSTHPGTQQFVTRFQEAYAYRPGTVEAQAYDAGLLALNALDAGAASRVAVLPALQSYGPIAGATGPLTVTSTGLDRPLFLLQVYDGKVEEVGGGTT